ncbi:MAG: PAS domain-containing protein [Thermodesulfobacteriota bacterium]
MNRRRLLILDENPIEAGATAESARKCGYDAIAVLGDWSQAAEKIGESRPDIILIGQAIVEREHGIETGRLPCDGFDLPVVLLLKAWDETLLRGIEWGQPVGYLCKPVTPRELGVAVEMTLRNHSAAKRVCEAVQRLELALEGSRIGIWDMNLQTREVFYSQTVGRIFGYEPNEYEGTIGAWQTNVHADDCEHVRQAFKAHVEGKTPRYESEHRIRTKSGEWRWSLARGRVISFDENGKALRMIGTTQDITERKLAQEHLKEVQKELVELVEDRTSELSSAKRELTDVMRRLRQANEKLQSYLRKYRLLVESVQEGICVVEGKFFRFANPYAASICGYPAEEIYKKPFVEFIHPEDREFVVHEYLNVLRGEPTRDTLSFRIMDCMGNVKWLDVSVVRIWWEGKPAALLFAVDSTERRNAEIAARRGELLLRTVFDNVNSGILVLGPDRAILAANDYCRSVLSISEEDIGKDLDEVAPGAHTLVATEPSMEFSGATLRLKDGTIRTLSFATRVPEETDYRIIAFRDITSIMEADERRRRAEQLAVVGEMAARLSHEIKNPMTSILSGLYLLQQRIVQGEEAQHILDMVVEEVRSLKSSISHVLEAARPSVLDVGGLYADQLVLNVYEVYRLNARSEGVDLRVTRGEDNVYLEGDEQALRRALSNLVQNALEACRRGDSIEIGWQYLDEGEAERIAPDFGAPIVKMFVRDTGPGLPGDLTESNLFRPFITTKESGTGLGLSIAREIVEEQGGEVIVSSTPNSGANFSIVLPAGERPKCWEMRCVAGCSFATADEPCCSCEVQNAERKVFCWNVRGRALWIETGMWPRKCVTCPVFRRSNLSYFVGAACRPE